MRHADNKTVIAVVAEDTILPMKGLHSDRLKIAEGRIEYALAKLSRDDFVLNTGGHAATTRHAGQFQSQLRYHFGRSESQAAFAKWVEVKNNVGRKGQWEKVTPDEIINALPQLDVRCYTFSKVVDILDHRQPCAGSTFLDQATIDDTLRRISIASETATGPTAGGKMAARARAATISPVRAVKARSSAGAKAKSAEAPDAEPVPMADREPAPSQPSASRKRRRVDVDREVRRVAAPCKAAQCVALPANKATRSPSGTPPPATVFPQLSTSTAGISLDDQNNPHSMRAQIASHWATIVEAATSITDIVGHIDRLVDSETRVTGHDFGAPLDDGRAERALVSGGGATSVADIPRLASALREAMHAVLGNEKAVADDPMDED